MEVDLHRRHDLKIFMDITFHAVPCAALSVDIMDASGTSDSDVNHARGVHLHKLRLGPDGRRLAGKGEYETPQTQEVVSERGADVMNIDIGAAMQQLGEMEDEIGAKEGCRLRGDVAVRRVAGRLHFAVHQQSFADLLPMMLTGRILPPVRNMSHTVHRVTFGPSFPGQVSPLDRTVRMEPEGKPGHSYKYYIKIVPTEYTTRFGTLLESSQYSVTEYSIPLLAPGQEGHGRHDAFVDLSYEFSPIIMHIHESPLGLLHFVVRLCAVVGGAVSVTRLADGLVHGAVRALGLSGGGGERGSSGGGGCANGSGSGGGGRPVSYSGGGGLLPTYSGSRDGHGSGGGVSYQSGGGGSYRSGSYSGHGGSYSGHGGGGSSGHGGLVGGLTSSIRRHSSAGSGGLLPTHSSGAGAVGGSPRAGAAGHGSAGGGALPSSPLGGAGGSGAFGSWQHLPAHGHQQQHH